MENRQLKALGLILVLPIVFAGIGYFGMKVFLSGSGPETAQPESRPSQEVSQTSKDDDKTQNEQVTQEDSRTETTQTEENEKTDGDAIVVSNEAESEDGVTDTEKASVVVEKKNYDLPSVNFFSLQVGSYSAKSNADKHVAALKEEGMNAYVFEGNNFKVMAGISGSRDGVDTIKQKVVQTVPDAFVKGIVVVPDAVKYTADEKEGLEGFQAIAKTYQERLQSNVSFISTIEMKSQADIQTYLESDVAKIEAMIVSINDYNGAQVFETPLNKAVQSLDSQAERIRQLINDENDGSRIFQVYIKELLNYNKIN
ncbi:SPOR domain-containing protein [Fusibacter sp. JL216-2]|uniref:SPOR domain-containing protein n=1 Tax=Fusibacter sp. JL216-2 TaxID=3071453 RepID=UPI003D352CCC